MNTFVKSKLKLNFNIVLFISLLPLKNIRMNTITKFRTKLAQLEMNLLYINNPDAFGDVKIKVNISDVNDKIERC